MTPTNLPLEQTQLLEQCLDEILDGKATLAEVLARYPEAAALKRELQTALLAARLTVDAPALSENSVKKLEARLKTAARPKQPAPRVVQFPAWQFASKWAAAFILVVVFALGAGGGTVAASANSQPGDTLYGVKRAWEQVIVFIANIAGRADDVYLHLAKVRFDEIYNLAQTETLSPAQLDDFALTLRATIRLADSDSTPSIVVFMMNAQSNLQLIPRSDDTRVSYQRVETLLQPKFDKMGQLVLEDTAPIQVTPDTETVMRASTPTALPTDAPTQPATETLEPSATFTATMTFTALPPSATPTPSRTPTPTVTPSPTQTLPFTPTFTLTPLTLPGQFVTATGVAPRPTDAPLLPTIAPIGGDGTGFRERETQAAVYATQTAIANGQVPPTATP